MPLNTTSISHPASSILIYEFMYNKRKGPSKFYFNPPIFFFVVFFFLLNSCFIPEVGALTHHHVGDFLKTGL